MYIFFLCNLFIASCRTDSLTNGASDAYQAFDDNILCVAPYNSSMVNADPVDPEDSALAESGEAIQDESTCEIERKCDLPNNIAYLKENLIPFRNLDGTSITGTGQQKDPFVVKCKNGHLLFENNFMDRLLLIWDKSNSGTWKISNFLLVFYKGLSFSRYSEITIKKLTEFDEFDPFTCTVPISGYNNNLYTFVCDITSFKNNQKLNTYGTSHLTLHITQKKNVFYVSCAKNSQEFGISCKENGKLMDTRYGSFGKEISSEDIEKRCNICPLKDLWQKILPMNMILSLTEAEKYFLQCSVNYAKIADKEDLEAKCSDEGEWEVYHLNTGIKVEFDNIYCEREGCKGNKLSGKSSYNESIVMKYTLAADLEGDRTEVPIEFIHLE